MKYFKIKEACQEIFGCLVSSFFSPGVLSLTLFGRILSVQEICVYLINLFNISVRKNFQHTWILKEFQEEHPKLYNPHSAINIFLHFPHIFSSVYPSIHDSYFFMKVIAGICSLLLNISICI